MRIAGIVAILLGSLGIAGECYGFSFPTAQWFFRASRDMPGLSSGSFPWFGWASTGALILVGLFLFGSSFSYHAKNPIVQKRWSKFRSIKRGYYSFLILAALMAIAVLDQLVVGKRALAVNYNGSWQFPAFLSKELKNKDFGVKEGHPEAPVDYRKLQTSFKKSGKGRVILPLIPHDPTGDTLSTLSQPLYQQEGIYHESRRPFWGLAARFHDTHREKIHLRYTFRDGVMSGAVDGWNLEGAQVYSAEYKNGEIITETYTGKGSKDDFIPEETEGPLGIYSLNYHPAPPSLKYRPASSFLNKGHLLGTNSQGNDVLAYLFGGLQVNFKAALIYLPIVYVIGMTIGLFMGFAGGWFDLLMQRIIEVFSNIPFLFVVIIVANKIPETFRGLPVILTILVAFGWMSMTYLMRTAAYRDKGRDYIAASRIIGASTPRILFRHLLPNTVAIIVTLVPFSMSSLIFSLTALDYLGFGLPPEYATWGRLLNDGLANLTAPWLVTSTFVVLVTLLVLITFVGEAIREAFDPKKFTYYR